MRGQTGFFDVDERLKRLSGLADHLEAFSAAVDFETFRADLVAALGYSDSPQVGRPIWESAKPGACTALMGRVHLFRRSAASQKLNDFHLESTGQSLAEAIFILQRAS